MIEILDLGQHVRRIARDAGLERRGNVDQAYRLLAPYGARTRIARPRTAGREPQPPTIAIGAGANERKARCARQEIERQQRASEQGAKPAGAAEERHAEARLLRGETAGRAGVLDADLARAARAALALNRTTCRAYAEGFTWRRASDLFLSNLVPMAGSSVR